MGAGVSRAAANIWPSYASSLWARVRAQLGHWMVITSAPEEEPQHCAVWVRVQQHRRQLLQRVLAVSGRWGVTKWMEEGRVWLRVWGLVNYTTPEGL